jgi:predicted dehydrogenase
MLKCGIIGAGMISQSGFDGLMKSGKAEVVAIADHHAGRLSSFASRNRVAKSYATAEDLIRDKSLEAVYIGVHMLDLALWVARDFDAESVSGSTYTKFGNRRLGVGGWGLSDDENLPFDVDDCALALVRMRSGATVQVEISWAAHQKEANSYNVEIFGTEAGAQVYPGEVYSHDADLNAHVNVTELRMPLRYPHKSRFVNFVNAVLDEEPPCVTHEEALKVQRIIDAVYQSSASRREVRL